jgi:hypothetical protein
VAVGGWGGIQVGMGRGWVVDGKGGEGEGEGEEGPGWLVILL